MRTVYVYPRTICSKFVIVFAQNNVLILYTFLMVCCSSGLGYFNGANKRCLLQIDSWKFWWHSRKM